MDYQEAIDEAITHAKEIAKRQRKESVEWLKESNEEGSHEEEISKGCKKCAEEHEQLADWLEELKQYRSIGTLEEVREAVEKKKPKKVIDIRGDKLKFGTCPCCGKRISNVEGGNYCQKCGNRLEWECV